MVDVSAKVITSRSATAMGRIVLSRDAFSLIHTTSDDPSLPSPSSNPALEKAKAKSKSKGDVLTTAQLAGVMACKSTSSLIPLCHPLPITHIQVVMTPEVDTTSVMCTATVRCEGKTGVEMEALTAVSVSLLTVWDMVKVRR